MAVPSPAPWKRRLDRDFLRALGADLGDAGAMARALGFVRAALCPLLGVKRIFVHPDAGRSSKHFCDGLADRRARVRTERGIGVDRPQPKETAAVTA